MRVTVCPQGAADSESGSVDKYRRTTVSADQEKDASALRYQRYKAVVDRLVERTDFALSHLREACHGERPAFVTRLVNELVENGWLLREDDSSSQGRGEFSVTRWLDEKMFGTQIKESPQQDRPRERLSAVGADNLRLAELLAILIRSGRPGESAVMAGEKLAASIRVDCRTWRLPGAVS